MHSRTSSFNAGEFPLIKRIFHTAIIIFLIFYPSIFLSTGPTDQQQKIEEYFAKGDYTALSLETIKYINDFYSESNSILYLNDLFHLDELVGYQKVLSVIDNYIKALQRENLPFKDEYILNARLLSDSLKLKHNITQQSAFKISGAYIQHWKRSPFYFKYGNGDFDELFPPEFDNTNYNYAINTSSPDGSIKLDNYYQNTSGIAYFSTTLNTLKNDTLRLESNCEYKLMLNGKPAIINSFNTIKRNLRLLKIDEKSQVKVVIKVILKKGGFFSLLTTDNNAQPVKRYSEKEISSFTNPVAFHEYNDGPLQRLMQETNSEFDIAWYFSTISSQESFSYYKQYFSKNTNSTRQLLYASDLISIPSKEQHFSVEGWKLLRTLWSTNTSLIPLKYYQAVYLKKAGKLKQAIKVVESASGLNSFYTDLYLLKLYREDEQLDKYEKFYKLCKKKYPYSSSFIKTYLLNKLQYDIKNFCTDAPLFLQNNRDIDIVKSLIQTYNQFNKLESASNLLNNYNLSDNTELQLLIIKKLISSGDYSLATSKLLALSLKSEDPQILYLLGLNKAKEGDDPDFYWKKLSKKYPSFSFSHQFFSFSKNNYISHLYEYIDKKKTDKLISSFQKEPSSEWNIPYKKEIYSINNDGTAYYLQDILIYINDDKDLRKYGEYKIPFSNHTEIIEACIYSKSKKSESISYSTIRGNTYITLDNLEKNTLVHITFQSLVASETYGTSFYQSPVKNITDYETSINDYSLLIRYPSNQQIHFFSNSKTKPQIKKKSSFRELTFSLKEIPKIKEETNNGSLFTSVPSFVFSSFTTERDFLSWYKGNFPSKKSLSLPDSIVRDDSHTLTKIHKIYQFVNNIVDTTNYSNFFPREPGDTLYTKTGSAEDKVFLCRQILSQYGIESFPALIQNKFFINDDFISIDNTNEILLYIPTETSGLWLDFSKRYLNAGDVSSEYTGCQAFIIKNTKLLSKQVISQTIPKEIGNFSIYLTESIPKYNLSTFFSGELKNNKINFLNKIYLEDSITKYNRIFSPSLLLENFSINNSNNFFSINQKGYIPNYFIKTDKFISIKPFLRKSNIHFLTGEEKRTQTLFIIEPIYTEDTYSIYLPDNLKHNTIDFTKELYFNKCKAFYHVEKKSNSDIIQVTHKLSIPQQKIDIRSYPNFKKFTTDIFNIEKKQFILYLKDR